MKLRTLLAFLLTIVAGLQSVKAQEAYAVYTSDNTTLTFYYDNQRSSRTGTTYDLNTGTNLPGWVFDGNNISVTRVVFNSSFRSARPTSTCSWFYNMTKLQSITSIELLDTREVTDMRSMFENCTRLTSLYIGQDFNTSKVTNMSYMFSGCQALTNLNLSCFDTAKVTDMSYMFSGCKAITSFDLSSFNTAKVTNMSNMFYNCKVTDLDLSSFNTAKVKNMKMMFYYCPYLKTILVRDNWSTTAVTTSDDMFAYCTSLVGGKGTTYDENHVDASYAHIDGGTSNPGYLSASIRGDVNLDGTVDIADAVSVLNAMAGQSVAGDANVNGDYDENGNPVIDIADLVTVLNIMAGQ